MAYIAYYQDAVGWCHDKITIGVLINPECNESLWLIPEGEAPIMGEAETVQVAYWLSYYTIEEDKWITSDWLYEFTAIYPNESLRIFP